MSKLIKIAVLFTLLSSTTGWAKGQSLKLEGEFSNITFSDGIVVFDFTGVLLDSSHPADRSGFPIWDFPIHVEGLKVASTDTICMDHKARQNYKFQRDEKGSANCMDRIEEIVAAVPVKQLRFTGEETKILQTGSLSFYDMAQIRRENLARREKSGSADSP